MTPGNLDLTLYRGATFGPVALRFKTSDDVAVDLTGWTPIAQVRLATGRPVALDLGPVLYGDPVDGEVRIYFTDEETAVMPRGDYVWDILLRNPAGEVLGPFLSGKFSIKDIVSKS